MLLCQQAMYSVLLYQAISSHLFKEKKSFKCTNNNNPQF